VLLLCVILRYIKQRLSFKKLIFIHKQKAEFPEIKGLEHWYKLAAFLFLRRCSRYRYLTQNLNIFQTNLEKEKYLSVITLMAIKIIGQEEILNIYEYIE